MHTKNLLIIIKKSATNPQLHRVHVEFSKLKGSTAMHSERHCNCITMEKEKKNAYTVINTAGGQPYFANNNVWAVLNISHLLNCKVSVSIMQPP